MAKKGAKLFVGLVAIGALTGIGLAISKQAKAAEITATEVDISDLQNQILSAPDHNNLNYYYNIIGSMLTAGELTVAQYDVLYTDYVKRFYYLIGASS